MYVVGWRLVERCQLSCVSCLGGVGDNVMFTLRLTRLLMLRSALLQVTSNERECGIQAAPRDGYIGQTMVVQNADTLVQMMSIDIWLKSCNACETREVQSYKKKLKKQSSLSQEFRESKKGTKARHIERPQTKWTRHGWKNRRHSVSRLPCSHTYYKYYTV